MKVNKNATNVDSKSKDNKVITYPNSGNSSGLTDESNIIRNPGMKFRFVS